MRALVLILIVISFSAYAQEDRKRIGFDLGAAPLYVHSEKVVDNWIGGRSPYGTLVTGAVTWNFRKTRDAIGVGGGIFLWGDRILYPVFVHIKAHPSEWCDDCALNNAFWQRTSVVGHIGSLIGQVETTDGALRPGLLSQAGLRYRIGTEDRERFHLGVIMNLFTFRGPYKIFLEGEWSEENAGFLTIGPALWLTF